MLTCSSFLELSAFYQSLVETSLAGVSASVLDDIARSFWDIPQPGGPESSESFIYHICSSILTNPLDE